MAPHHLFTAVSQKMCGQHKIMQHFNIEVLDFIPEIAVEKMDIWTGKPEVKRRGFTFWPLAYREIDLVLCIRNSNR